MPLDKNGFMLNPRTNQSRIVRFKNQEVKPLNNVSRQQEKIYFGLDISQKTIEIFALKGEKEVSFGKIPNTQKSLNDFFDNVPVSSQSITVALETGTHSAWISRQLEARGYEIIVAHARDLAFIYKGDKKSDRIDAEKLARMARADKKLLHPVKVIDKKKTRRFVGNQSKRSACKAKNWYH